jgi:hypothetical protein
MDVTLVTNIKLCVIGHQMCHRALLVSDFNKVWGRGGVGGQKVVPRPSADYFVLNLTKRGYGKMHLSTTKTTCLACHFLLQLPACAQKPDAWLLTTTIYSATYGVEKNTLNHPSIEQFQTSSTK